VPGFIAAISPLLNWATVFVAFALGYYLMLSPKLAVGMLPVVVVMMIVNYAIWLQVGGWIWLVAVIIFFVAWVGQFWGHKIEGKKPSFLKDLQFLLIGPLWLLSFIYQRAGLSY
jgi:uncharacterized membrane protein YGL010W